MIPIHFAALTLVWLFPLAPARGQSAPTSRPEPASSHPAEEDKADKDKDPFRENQVVTRHQLVVGGQSIDYTATAGTLQLKEEDGKGRASIFFVAYTKDGEPQAALRPLTFCFNGGPGSSSVWLHMGAFGPKRVLVDAGSESAPPPYRMEDNGESLLDLSDLVFIDPPTTGYSRALPGQDAARFHGVSEDVEAVGEFIRLYVTRFQRWASPKFLSGESYGTTRAAALAGHLQDRLGMNLNGIVLVSLVLDFQTILWDRGNDLPAALYLPSYASTAWYHKRLAGDLQAQPVERVAALAEQYARGEYAQALFEGQALDAARRQRVEEQLARFTGLSREFIRACNLRVDNDRYCKELLRAERKTVGRLDSRFTGIDADAAGERGEYDPSYAAIQGPYTAALNDYMRGTLGWMSDLPYEILSGRVHPWKFGAENRYLNVAETLRAAMSKNRALRVFVAAGLYDFATPSFAARYTIEHLGLEPELQAHVEMRSYEAGHMMYVHPPVLKLLKSDLARFYATALAR